ncbi:Spo0E like sporulation regulatory protein [Alkalithermobacter thermoalcaliphilus JW-YL-7 = DSM 7308]|uniref:Spo0E like sporulation regulatory protein n=1 Tax=Alkalithermobacter thermoalcaliphilus JW-YL-7 = DSM 7308 TaxID=1121328 RepID=A0A150FRS4_CLOPD|nr:hypothetical protein JWYL7_1396 [[Clostridium] paradoxum JW-YL-7 = DSM 7308]SHK38078.1 Spo0E like sporulation regulatory protein [[Clostridium] paradoxum JW-YL-7 = DSM 7308]
MTKIEEIRREIEDLREEINRYVQYPDIFKEELESTSMKIDSLINEYLKLSHTN